MVKWDETEVSIAGVEITCVKEQNLRYSFAPRQWTILNTIFHPQLRHMNNQQQPPSEAKQSSVVSWSNRKSPVQAAHKTHTGGNNSERRAVGRNAFPRPFFISSYFIRT